MAQLKVNQLSNILSHDKDDNSDSRGSEEESDVPYRVWFVTGAIASGLAIWSAAHYELIAKIAWTIIAPGFTLSQTWGARTDSRAITGFGVVLVLHVCLMELLFPRFPKGHYGYILVAAVIEIMTFGLVYQVWIKLRTRQSD